MGKRMMKEKCKLCNSKLSTIFWANGCELKKCVQCGFVQVANEEESLSYQYDETYFINSKYKDNSALEKEFLRRKKLIAKYIKSGALLDYGCATGEFVQYVSNIYDAEGCDVSEDAIRLAKGKNHFFCDKLYSISEWEQTKKIYGAICLWDVIEHVSNPCETLLRIKKRMTKNGYLFISTPNIGALWARILKSKWPFMTPPEHMSFFSYKSINKLARLMDMEIVEWKSKGKWANVGFILYKFNRVSNIKIPDRIIKIFQRGFLSKLKVYVPTCDVQYVVMKNRNI